MNELLLEIRQVKRVSNLAQLEKTLSALPGITAVSIDPATNVARIEFENTDLKEMLRVMEFRGYEARLRQTPASHYAEP